MSRFNLNKGSLIPIILQLLSENKQMYGYEITQQVKDITKVEIIITEGALYPALHKLESQGLLETETKKVNNRLRKYYKMTEKGNKETIEIIAELRSFIDNLQILVQPKPI